MWVFAGRCVVKNVLWVYHRADVSVFLGGTHVSYLLVRGQITASLEAKYKVAKSLTGRLSRPVANWEAAAGVQLCQDTL